MRTFFDRLIYGVADMLDENLARTGDVILCINTKGCMGSNHEFDWIGVVDSVEHNVEIYGTSRLQSKAHVRVLKKGSTDVRDHAYKMESFIREDTSAQRLASNLIVLFK